jgi:hypothetical protein
MDEMMSPYALPPNTFLYASFGLLLVQGFLFSLECLWRTLTGTASIPITGPSSSVSVTDE